MVQERLPLFAGKKFEKTLGPTGSMAPVAFDLGPARSRGAAYHFHPIAGGSGPMTILLETR